MAQDILTDNFDLAFANGDFALGESDQQHVEHILLARPGDYKNVPWIGVGIEDYFLSPLSPAILEGLNRNIRLQLESDTAKVQEINTDVISNIQITAKYE